eukprot:COSAG04_NODE_1373_length_7033_cov_5.180560_4_plen_179_part_00
MSQNIFINSSNGRRTAAMIAEPTEPRDTPSSGSGSSSRSRSTAKEQQQADLYDAGSRSRAALEIALQARPVSQGAVAAGPAGGGRRRRRPLSVGTPAAGAPLCSAAARRSPMPRLSPTRRLATAGACGEEVRAGLSGLPLTELLQGCAKNDGTLSTPDLKKLHAKIAQRRPLSLSGCR